ncbi:hypothetical protein SAMN05216223_13245 [Actinacidiphila yanglinensis]|uniref:DUF2264 domain-containing protein n=1 Tax=Actinacidiphila yanglinensis TaxID=310779 RepID=A0A1H6EBQ4_9ACTN|nr:DUF2264 domain-containing protein [Actinacidiphila yanglinensis]SEG95172.1 hypothetical protein SAMN05216223_13245 [Actinacidiphila yanglinensis]
MTQPPAPDRDLSPYTGWTRAHWTAAADRLLSGVRPFASDGNALIDLPGDHPSDSGRWCDGLEGFARTFLLAAFRLGGHPPVSHGPLAQLADFYARGLAHGTDPRAADRWPTLREKGQAKVECASIALALHLTRGWIWDRLHDDVRARTVAWMSAMLGAATPANNWLWFRCVTEAFLRSVGGPWSPADIAHAIERTESWYAGDGWYSDGDFGAGPRNFDHYNGWAMLFYPLWYCAISGPDAEPGLRQRYSGRLDRHLADAQYLVGADGGPLFHGRSLTYRFATLAPFWTGALFDATPLSPGLTRRIGSGVLRYFLRSGAVDAHGLLPLGWHGAFPAIRQTYSGAGSPYWASKGFAGLLLPADHPVWTAVEEPLPVERGDVHVTLTAPGWLVSGTRGDGVVRVVNHGGDHTAPGRTGFDEPCYDRYAYSTACGPDLGEPDPAAPVDSHVALIAADGRASVRRPYQRLFLRGRVGVSRHRAHWPHEPARHGDPPRTRLGPVLTTASVLRGAVEVRIVRIDGPDSRTDEPFPADEPHARPPDRPGPWRLRVGGAALAAAWPDALVTGTGGGSARVTAPDRGLTSAVLMLSGAGRYGVIRRRDANAFGRWSACPWVETAAPVVSGEIHTVAVVLGGSDNTPAGVRIAVRRGGPDEPGDVVTVTWPDGACDVVPLDPEPTAPAAAGPPGPRP